MPARTSVPLHADLSFSGDDRQSFSGVQIKLLMAIDECGSITRAAKKVGISYKTAWERIDNLNNLSPEPLVQRATGGAGGGGTTLTGFGREMVAGFNAMEGEHSRFLTQLGGGLRSVSDIAKFLGSTKLRTSARNQYRGVITAVSRGEVNVGIRLRIGEGLFLTALITNDSGRDPGFRKGREVIALIKSSWVLLSKDLNLKTSARNNLRGTVMRVVKGGVNSEVILDLGAGKSICAVVTNRSVAELKLRKGDPACAFFKASSVILMATDQVLSAESPRT